MAAQWKCEYPTPHTLFFSFLHVPHFSKKYSRGVEPPRVRARRKWQRNIKTHQNCHLLKASCHNFRPPPLNISEKKILYLYVGLHLQKMFQFVEFVVHVTRFGGKNHDFCRYSQILETSEEYFCSTPPPPPSHHKEIRQCMLFFYTT